MTARTSLGHLLAVATVLGVALALRVVGLDWDRGHLFHPDERAILMKVWDLRLPWPPDPAVVLDPQVSPLNPRWFPYGSLPLYLLMFAGFLAAAVDPALATLEHLRLVGRILSVTFDVGTILLVFLTGSRLFRPAVGLLAAALAAVTVLHIQLSHFYTVDVLLTFCVMVTVYGGALTIRDPSARSSLLMGLGLGLGLATKVSIAPLAVTVAAALLLGACRDEEGRVALAQLWRPGRLAAMGRGLVITAGLAAAMFLLAEPFALLDRGTFLRDVREQSEMVLRVRDYPYTRQYVDTPAYLYPIWQLSVWGFGLPLALGAWVGLLVALRRGLWEQRAAELLLLSWLVPYFLVTGAFPVKFLRYYLPIVPVLLILASRLLLDWRARVSAGLPAGAPQRSAWSSVSPRLPSFLIVLLLATTAAYALAYVHIYARPHPAVAAAAWIRENVPPGTLLLREHWDEGLPQLQAYPQNELTLYEPDDARKAAHLVQELQRGQYILLYSNRLYGTISRLKERYPLSTRYYEALFRGELGFELVHAVASYPSLGGASLVDDTFSRPGLPVPELLQDFRPTPLTLNLGYADESFTVYDHPLVLVFQKTQPRSPEQIAAILSPRVATAPPVPSGPRLLLDDAGRAAQQAGGTWRDLFDPASVANRVPVLVWLLTVQGLGMLVLPVVLLLFQSLPDRGYPFARALGLLLVGYLAWLGASVGVLPFTRASILLIALAVGLTGAVLARRFAPELQRAVGESWRILAIQEVVFLGAFALFYGLRLLNPDLWHPWRGGEKPMDFAYLNAVVKSTWMPPYDPWFAGGYLNYYYFGQMLVATLIKMTGILPEVAYNLAVPLFFALLASGVFSVVYNLTESTRRALRVRPSMRSESDDLSPGPSPKRGGEQVFPIPRGKGGEGVRGAQTTVGPVLAGVAGMLMVAVLGNLDGLVQLLDGLQRSAGWRLQSNLPWLADLSGASAGIVRVLAGGAALPEFDYWRSSRMMPPTISITEFPFFTFLFGDLHAHLMALPYTVLAIALALNLALSAARRWWADLAALATLGWVLGALRWMNSWDLPTYFLLGIAAILIQEGTKRPRPAMGMLLAIVLKLALLYGATTVLWLPFAGSFEQFYAGVTASPQTTPPSQYLLIHGLVIWILGGFLVVEGMAALGGAKLVRQLGLGLRYWFHLRHVASLLTRLRGSRQTPPNVTVLVLAGAGLVGASSALMGQPLAGLLLLPLTLTGVLAWRDFRDRQLAGPQRLFVLALTGLALAIGIGVDFATLQGDIDRMNTVFKFYLQAWVLYGIAAAFALWWLVSGRRRRHEDGAAPPAVARHSLAAVLRPWQTPFLGVLALLFAASVIYPLAATPVRLRDRFQPLPPTPDGLAYLHDAVVPDEHGPLSLAWDEAAIRWLRANVAGSPVILEGVTPIYRWGGRVSITTGLPAVLGWDWHQRQQRWAYQTMVDDRLQDVKTLYSAPQPAGTLDTLRKYGVQYVYVGELERLYYPAAGLAKFRALVGRGLSVAYENPVVTIYQVDQGS